MKINQQGLVTTPRTTSLVDLRFTIPPESVRQLGEDAATQLSALRELLSVAHERTHAAKRLIEQQAHLRADSLDVLVRQDGTSVTVSICTVAYIELGCIPATLGNTARRVAHSWLKGSCSAVMDARGSSGIKDKDALPEIQKIAEASEPADGLTPALLCEQMKMQSALSAIRRSASVGVEIRACGAEPEHPTLRIIGTGRKEQANTRLGPERPLAASVVAVLSDRACRVRPVDSMRAVNAEFGSVGDTRTVLSMVTGGPPVLLRVQENRAENPAQTTRFAYRINGVDALTEEWTSDSIRHIRLAVVKIKRLLPKKE